MRREKTRNIRVSISCLDRVHVAGAARARFASMHANCIFTFISRWRSHCANTALKRGVHCAMDDEFSLGGALLAKQDALEAVLQAVDATELCQIKAVSVAWCNHVRRYLCNRLWVRWSRREGQPAPAGVDSITDLDVECLNHPPPVSASQLVQQ